MVEPLVSIIIPTFNSEKTLTRCVESIKNQTFQNIEVIVVDNYSCDRTGQIAKDNNVTVILLYAERAEAKNYGVSISNGKYIFFIDSDMELTNRVVEKCIELIKKDPLIGGVIVPERSKGSSFWVGVRDFERSFYADTVIESARFFLSKLVTKVGGFDEDLVFFEESTLPQKIENMGYNVNTRIEGGEIIHHEENFSLIKWLKKKYYYGKTSKRYREKYHIYGQKQINPLYRAGIFVKDRRFYSSPLRAVGVIILKLLEYFSFEMGCLYGKIF